MATLETRIISGKGLVKMPLNDKNFTQAKIITVFCSVVRRATNEYLNFAYNPPRSRYCTLSFIRAGYVIHTASMEYAQQSYDFYPEISAQTLYAVECSYAGVLQSFINLAANLGATWITIEDHIKNWVHTNLMFDEIKVVCYADTAVQITVVSQKFDLCEEQEDKDPVPPPAPPSTVPSVSPGTPLQDADVPLSDPYSGADDDGDTVPHPIDVVPEPPEFPQGERCTRYHLYAKCYYNPGASFLETYVDVHGEIEDAGVSEDGISAYVICHGELVTPYSPCSPTPVYKQLMSASAGLIADTFEYSITPY